MINTDILESISRKFNHIKAELDERGSRRWAACEALELGHGGIKAVATGPGERTIRRGCQEINATRSKSIQLCCPEDSEPRWWEKVTERA